MAVPAEDGCVTEWVTTCFLSLSACPARQTYFSMLFLHLRDCIAETKWGVFYTCEGASEANEETDTLIPRTGILDILTHKCCGSKIHFSIYAVSKHTFSFDLGFPCINLPGYEVQLSSYGTCSRGTACQSRCKQTSVFQGLGYKR